MDGSGANSRESEDRVTAAADPGVDAPFLEHDVPNDTCAASDKHGDNVRPPRPLPPDIRAPNDADSVRSQEQALDPPGQ